MKWWITDSDGLQPATVYCNGCKKKEETKAKEENREIEFIELKAPREGIYCEKCEYGFDPYNPNLPQLSIP